MKEKLPELFKFLSNWFLQHGVKIIVVIILAFLLKLVFSKLIKKLVRKYAAKGGGASVDDSKRAETLIKIFIYTLNVVVFFIAAIMVFDELGINMKPVLASAGIIGLAVGFGMQYLIKDLVTGIFIIMENQYRIGDVVNFGNGIAGVVENISLRITTLRDMNGVVHYVPHGSITVVSNSARSFAKFNFVVGIAYGSDINKAIKIINETGKKLAEEQEWKDKIIVAPSFLRVDDLADSSVNLKVTGTVKPLEQWNVEGEMKKRVKEAFDAGGVEIPFPQRVVHMQK